jgi:hypothetical protein
VNCEEKGEHTGAQSKVAKTGDAEKTTLRRGFALWKKILIAQLDWRSKVEERRRNGEQNQ